MPAHCISGPKGSLFTVIGTQQKRLFFDLDMYLKQCQNKLIIDIHVVSIGITVNACLHVHAQVTFVVIHCPFFLLCKFATSQSHM